MVPALYTEHEQREYGILSSLCGHENVKISYPFLSTNFTRIPHSSSLCAMIHHVPVIVVYSSNIQYFSVHNWLVCTATSVKPKPVTLK
jgi:hypothetical protein